jgi:hypothetical protein
MTGVHATCIEKWVSAHRAYVDGERSRYCPVCQSPYVGTNTTPGMMAFIRMYGILAGGMLVRCMLLIKVLIIGGRSSPLSAGDFWIIGAFYIAVVYLISVLTISLARGSFTKRDGDWVGHPPEQRALGRLFCSDKESLRLHVFELAGMSFFLGVILCVVIDLHTTQGNGAYRQVFLTLPLFGLVMIPFVKATIRPLQCNTHTLRNICKVLVGVVGSLFGVLIVAHGAVLLLELISADMMLALVALFSQMVLFVCLNWSLLVEKYMDWQNRHSSFRILVPPAQSTSVERPRQY